MPTGHGLNRHAAFRIAVDGPTRVLRPPVAGGRHGDGTSSNLLVQGDNLDALKALLPFYRGQVKCIVVDLPTKRVAEMPTSCSKGVTAAPPGPPRRTTGSRTAAAASPRATAGSA
jgi:hypothetical protein